MTIHVVGPLKDEGCIKCSNCGSVWIKGKNLTVVIEIDDDKYEVADLDTLRVYMQNMDTIEK